MDCHGTVPERRLIWNMVDGIWCNCGSSFLLLSARSLPGMLECPGIHWMKTVDEMEGML